jgi:hypothetical protein
LTRTGKSFPEIFSALSLGDRLLDQIATTADRYRHMDYHCSVVTAPAQSRDPPRTPPRQITRTPKIAPGAPYHHNVRHVIMCSGQHSERAGDTRDNCAVCSPQRRSSTIKRP